MTLRTSGKFKPRTECSPERSVTGSVKWDEEPDLLRTSRKFYTGLEERLGNSSHRGIINTGEVRQRRTFVGSINLDDVWVVTEAMHRP